MKFSTIYCVVFVSICLSACDRSKFSEPTTNVSEKVESENKGEFGKPWTPNETSQKQIQQENSKIGELPSDQDTGWYGRRFVDEMTDKEASIAFLEASNLVKVWLSEVRPSLTVRCKNGKTDVNFDIKSRFDSEYGRYDQAMVTIRFDSEKAYSVVGTESTDNQAIFFPQSLKFAKKLMTSERVLIQFTPFNGSPQTAIFNLKNQRDQYLGDVQRLCKW